MIRNTAGQSIGAGMVDATTGAAFAGAVTVYVTVDAGTQAIGSVGSGACASEGNGYFTYAPSADETNGSLIAFTFIGTGAIPVTIQVATVTAAQQSALAEATGTLVLTGLTLVEDALRELQVLNASDPASGEDADYGLRKLNRIFDNWNAEHRGVYADQFDTDTLTASLSPHTIGPTGTWVVDQRPVTIDSMQLVIDDITYPIRIRDAKWWANQSQKTLTSTQPTDCYYEPSWPNGNLYFWPIPETAYDVERQTRRLLASLTLTDSFSLPPGYQDAITLTLAEDLAAPFKAILSPQLVLKAREARARIFDNNTSIPSLETCDSGLPGARGGYWDYRTGELI